MVLTLLKSMREESGVVPTVSCYNVVIDALVKAGEWQRALRVLTNMKREGVRPTEFTYTRCMVGTSTVPSNHGLCALCP